MYLFALWAGWNLGVPIIDLDRECSLEAMSDAFRRSRRTVLIHTQTAGVVRDSFPSSVAAAKDCKSGGSRCVSFTSDDQYQWLGI